MRIGGVDYTAEDKGIGDLRKAADLSRGARHEAPTACPRIALLTPYSGHNLGDAAIQDGIIGNLRLRFPGAQISGVTLNSDNFLERHGTGAFPLCGPSRPFYGMCRGKITDQPGWSFAPPTHDRASILKELRRALKRVPVLWSCLRRIRALAGLVGGELRHCVRGYRFLRTQDLLIVSGGGQLDEEWGGPWGHPFALFKWAVLARIARVPYAVASVGACKVSSTTCRVFLSAALRMARYRSYRDKNSREIAAGLLRRATADAIVPDMAFSLPSSELPPPARIRSLAQDRRIIAISPIAYAKPGIWVYEDAALYDRYLEEMARVMRQLLQRDYFLVIVWSGVGDDDRIVPEILERLDRDSKQKAARQMHIPVIRCWKDLVASLQEADFLIASRLHSTILGFITQKPTIAISFDPKVDWVMQDLGQTDYLLHIRDFTAADVIEALDRITPRKDVVVKQIASYRQRILAASSLQYDKLAELVPTVQ